MFMHRPRTRFAARVAIATCLVLSVAVPISSRVAGADAFASHGCASQIPPNGFAKIDMNIKGVADPEVFAFPPPPIFLTGLELTFTVSRALIGAALAVGSLTAAPDLAHLGNQRINNPPDGLTTADFNAGIDVASVAAGGVKLAIKGTNTVETVQTATNLNPRDTTFYVTANVNDGSNVQIYSTVTAPPTPAPPRVTPSPVDALRTGTLVPGDLDVAIPLWRTWKAQS